MAETLNYGKRSVWQWVIIYLIIGAIIYGLIYYFVLANRDKSIPGTSSNMPQQTNQQTYP